MDDNELLALLNGEWVQCRSTNVQEATYIEDTATLWVTFKAKGRQPERTYQFFDVTPEAAQLFGEAPSKGGHIWDHYTSQGIFGHEVG